MRVVSCCGGSGVKNSLHLPGSPLLLVSQPAELPAPFDRPPRSIPPPPPPCLAPRPPPSPLHLALYNRFPSVFDCLSVCVSRLKSALLPDSILSLCYLFFMLLLSISVTSLMPNILRLPATLSQRHPLSPSSLPSAACLLVLSRLRWCDCESPPPPSPLQQQTLFTLLLNKPEGEHDPR